MRPQVTKFERTLTKDGSIEPYQGANPLTGYRGDRTIFDQGQLTIQIYQYSRVNDRTGNVLAFDVPQISIILPYDIAVGMVVQSQGGE